ncbi:hypothetical protein PHLCEN_2v7933 [Hermanssonia centrifuga]|uniref:Sulfhydryl oxidase n=1 Tax=Hermanssonia centrifuga TaxID=98765 RepID=A0A2R6NV53_9APHY|nr:hypothetical protein PHLCEN_2v7933 [Hermanssonia centrifuga]
MTLRFPETPTQDERDALNSYFHLLSRLYPCGECAEEFQQLLKKFPPQLQPEKLSSKSNSNSLRLCAVHNQVNARLHKPEFDCANLDATYDCGCGDEPVGTAKPVSTDFMDLEVDPSKDRDTGVKLIKGVVYVGLRMQRTASTNILAGVAVMLASSFHKGNRKPVARNRIYCIPSLPLWIKWDMVLERCKMKNICPMA